MLAVIATGAVAGTDINSCTTIFLPGEYELNTSIDNASTCIYITSSDVILDGAGHTINGANAGLTYGVHVYNSSITLTNVTVKNLKVTNWDTGIYYQNAQNGNVANNTASSNGYAIYLFSSSRNNLTGNNASSNGAGIFLYSSSNNNNLTGNNASSNAIGIYLFSASNNTLTGNNASSDSYGIFLVSSGSNNLTGNNASSNSFTGIHLASSSDNNTLTGNNASSNGDTGIYLDSSSNNNLTGNNASNNYLGIWLLLSDYNTLSGNNASSNHGNGILLDSSSSNSLTGNNASSNTNIGIYLGSSGSNSLTGNNASSNNFGIYLWDSSNNTLTGNKASNNTLWAFYSKGNSINNTVINLTINPTISFTGKDVAIKSTSSPPPDPDGYKNISKFINATNNSADSWLFLNISYSNSDVSGLNEGSLRMWRYNGSAWSQVPDPNNVNTGQKEVYANITAFSIFAPMGLPKTQAKVPALNPAGLVALAGALSFVAISRIRRRGK